MRWYTVFIVSSLILLTLTLLHYVKLLIDGSKQDIAHIYNADHKQRGSDVLIFAYMRGGSTLVGEVFGHSEETMYFYEPLNKMSEFHFSTRFQRCSLQRWHCKTNVTYSKLMTDTINALFTCDINKKVWNSLHIKLMAYKGGESWKNIDILDSEKSRNKILKMCKMSKIRVSKILRLGMESIEDIIIKNPEIKILFFLRDPRAVIHSRQNVNFIGDDIEDTFALASSLCTKMELDFEIKTRLETKYPDTFYTIKYEKFTKNMSYWTNQILRFLGHRKNNISKYLKRFNGNSSEEQPSNTKRRDAYRTGNRWRETININDVMVIDNVCKSTMERLGYVTVTNVNYLRNISLPLIS